VINRETTSACIVIYHSDTLDLSCTDQSEWLFVTNGGLSGPANGQGLKKHEPNGYILTVVKCELV
jgi:hypothetical protein